MNHHRALVLQLHQESNGQPSYEFLEQLKLRVSTASDSGHRVKAQLKAAIVLVLLDQNDEAISLISSVLAINGLDRSHYSTIHRLEYVLGVQFEKNHYLKLYQDIFPPLWEASVVLGTSKLGPDLLEYEEFYFIPIPKNASSSITANWVKKTFSRDVRQPHQYYKNPFHTTVAIDSYQIGSERYKPVLCITRDPLDRLESYVYGNILYRKSLVRKFGEALLGLGTTPKPTDFVGQLHKYCLLFDDVMHHTLPQSLYIRPFYEHFSVISFPIEYIQTLYLKYPDLGTIASPPRMKRFEGVRPDSTSVEPSQGTTHKLETLSNSLALRIIEIDRAFIRQLSFDPTNAK
jgi:hypothetical protein